MLKMIDLFAGIGGIRIAFENNGVACVGSSEIDKNACETYELNFKEKPLGDISKIAGQDLPYFDIIAGGFPCQPFSLGGLRKGFQDTRGTLFFEIARLIEERKPKAFFLENVSGIVSHDKGKTLETIEESLRDLGYIFQWRVMNACHYGIPQNRSRWYCIGFKKGLGITFEAEGVERKEADSSRKNALAEEDDIIYHFPKKRPLSFTVKDVIGKGAGREYAITETARKNIDTYLPAFQKTKRFQKENVLLANEIRASRCNFRCDGIAPCLTAKMGTGGNNVPVYVKGHRKLTERECLKLMGFPDWYQMKPNSMHSYKQIGNSVVVEVVDMLAREMVRVLEAAQHTEPKV